jgi:hypothetical protein
MTGYDKIGKKRGMLIVLSTALDVSRYQKEEINTKGDYIEDDHRLNDLFSIGKNLNSGMKVVVNGKPQYQEEQSIEDATKEVSNMFEQFEEAKKELEASAEEEFSITGRVYKELKTSGEI